MTHINLDDQPEVVKQFVLGLSASPNGTVLESEGRQVACVVPAPNSETIGRNGEWTNEKNRRRGELIDRKYSQGLSPAEAAELAVLQDEMYRYIDRVAPLPISEARRMHQELLQKAAKEQHINKS